MFKPEISTYSKTSFLKAFCPLELKMKTLFSSLETIFFIIRQRAEKARINVSQAVGVPPTREPYYLRYRSGQSAEGEQKS